MSEFWVDEGFLRQEAGLNANERRVNVQAGAALEIRGPSVLPITDLPTGDAIARLGGVTGLVRNAVVTLTSPIRRTTLQGRTWVQVTRWHMHYNIMTRAELAQEILERHNGRSATGRRINLLRWSDMTDANRRSTVMNITDTAAGRQSTRSDVSSGENPATIGGTVFICENLLIAILRMSDQSTGMLQINSLTGGRHYFRSRHYGEHIRYTALSHMPFRCIAVDMQVTGGLVNGTGRSREEVLDHLENTWGFMTQRNFPLAPDRRLDSGGNAGLLHLEIWGRS